jgi:hypothetical protein
MTALHERLADRDGRNHMPACAAAGDQSPDLPVA